MENDLTYLQAVEKYPNFPKFIILKLDLYRRGLVHSNEVIEKFGKYPGPIVLRDGTSVLTAAGECMPDDHYIMDLCEGKLGIFYKNNLIEEADFSPKPLFYGKKTSSGTPMESIGMTRPQVLNIWTTQYCHFWEGRNACKFCSVNVFLKERLKGRDSLINLLDLS